MAPRRGFLSTPNLFLLGDALDVEDNLLSDGRPAEQAVTVLEELQHTQFFLAVGFEKPHLPFYVPREILRTLHATRV